ncbi:Spindle pole body protein [Phaffia rhodozyma]|uniref:Spindle pole body protein n=1 Tax=Phaffia rhodozyma TaxID=264483 RepID=A0A0F7SFE3_PHARH|nr:Spindle pole body protein [Phaffia rhodozyma]
MPPWNAARARIQLKLSIQRLQLLQDKKTAIAKKTRRDIADLLLKNKVETARVRCEVVIGDEITVELLELLSLYAELLLARFALLDNTYSSSEPDQGIHEAVCTLIYAGPRTEVAELHHLRELLVHKFSRDFAIAAIENKDGCVNDRVFAKLQIYRPPTELIDAYLDEIARTYKVNWSSGREDPANGDVPAGFEQSTEKPDDSASQPTSTDPASLPNTTVAGNSSTINTTTPNPPPPSYQPASSSSSSSLPSEKTDASNESKPSAPPAPSARAQQKSADDLLAARFAALKQR